MTTKKFNYLVIIIIIIMMVATVTFVGQSYGFVNHMRVSKLLPFNVATVSEEPSQASIGGRKRGLSWTGWQPRTSSQEEAPEPEQICSPEHHSLLRSFH